MNKAIHVINLQEYNSVTLEDVAYQYFSASKVCYGSYGSKFLELAMSLLDFSPRIPLGTLSILLWTMDLFITCLSTSYKWPSCCNICR